MDKFYLAIIVFCAWLPYIILRVRKRRDQIRHEKTLDAITVFEIINENGELESIHHGWNRQNYLYDTEK